MLRTSQCWRGFHWVCQTIWPPPWNISAWLFRFISLDRTSHTSRYIKEWMEDVDWKALTGDISRVGTRGQADAQTSANNLHKFPFYFLVTVTGMLFKNASTAWWKCLWSLWRFWKHFQISAIKDLTDKAASLLNTVSLFNSNITAGL